MMDHATPTSSVSAFCRAVLARLLPSQLFGSGPVADQNLEVLLCKVDQFIVLRRFESFSLHHVVQKMKANILSLVDAIAFVS
jgi:telomerase reverse transcriptase